MEFNRKELDERLVKDLSDDDTEDFMEERKSNIKIFFPLIAAAAICFSAYAWYTDKIAISREGQEAPVIKADKEPVRVKPADPGGMEIANRDKSVYDAISGTGDQLPKVVRIIPSPEEPLSRDTIKKAPELAQLVEDEEVASPEVPVEKTEEPQKEIATNEAPTKEIAPVVVKEVAQNTAETKEAAPQEKQIAKAEPVAKPDKLVAKQELMSRDMEVPSADEMTVDNIKVVSVPTGSQKPQEASVKNDSGYRVQLGSYRTQEDVLASWNLIKNKHGETLKGADMKVEKADLGTKGIFFRLQVGEFSSESDSRRICHELMEKNQGCFIVKK